MYVYIHTAGQKFGNTLDLKICICIFFRSFASKKVFFAHNDTESSLFRKLKSNINLTNFFGKIWIEK